jgi:hypothetical protein
VGVIIFRWDISGTLGYEEMKNGKIYFKSVFSTMWLLIARRDL